MCMIIGRYRVVCYMGFEHLQVVMSGRTSWHPSEESLMNLECLGRVLG